MSKTEITQRYPCVCGETKEGVCPSCGTSAEVHKEVSVEVQGLSVVMWDMDDVIYHDANRWGSSRKPLLHFINKHGLLAGQDWYEA